MTEAYWRAIMVEAGPWGVARSSPGVDPLLLPASGEVTQWARLALTIEEGEFCDYQPSVLALRLCSEPLQALLAERATEQDSIQWLPVEISRRKEIRRYYALHFPSPADVLDEKRSLIVNGRVVKPALSRSKALSHSVFTYRRTSVILLVSDSVRAAMTEAGMTGFEFAKVPVV